MARGDLLTFNAFRKEVGDGTFDMDTDVFRIVLITTLPLLTQTTPNLTDFVEVTAGGGYSTGGITLTGVTWTETAGVSTFDSTLLPLWTASAGSPTNIVAALVINAAGAAVCFIDMTVDGGTTPASLVAGNISVAFNASGMFALS